jgi:hypothetical protein
MLTVLRDQATHSHQPIDSYACALHSLPMMGDSHTRTRTVKRCATGSWTQPTLDLATISPRPTASGSSLLNSDCCQFSAFKPTVSSRSFVRLPPSIRVSTSTVVSPQKAIGHC